MRRPATIATCAALLVTLAPLDSLARAQDGSPVLPRPKAVVADTNDALAYFDYGVQVFETDPGQAAAAFYWASRINPGNADALYGRRAALLMANDGLRTLYIDGGRRARDSKPLRALDSLYLRALNLNPLLYRRLDRRLLTAHIVKAAERNLRRAGSTVSRMEIDYVVENWLRDADDNFRGWIAYGDGRFDAALEYYANAMKSARFKAGFRIERGRIFGMIGQIDSAVAELNAALTEMRSRDTKDLVYFYDSKALFEHTIGTLLEQQDDVAGAREAYGKALQEDLSFYPAHLRLGMLALGQKDTATALSELDLAVQIAGSEPYVRYVYGWALAAAGKRAEAIEQLAATIELEPYFALPHLTLGQMYEQSGDGKNAIAGYSGFLARASQTDPQRAFAMQRLKEVSEIMAAMPAKPGESPR